MPEIQLIPCKNCGRIPAFVSRPVMVDQGIIDREWFVYCSCGLRTKSFDTYGTSEEACKQACALIWNKDKMEELMKNLVDKHNFWVMFAMFLFCITKVVALVCATIIALRGNIWIGAALFIGAIVFRITWTFMPDVEKQSVRESLKGEDES